MRGVPAQAYLRATGDDAFGDGVERADGDAPREGVSVMGPGKVDSDTPDRENKNGRGYIRGVGVDRETAFLQKLWQPRRKEATKRAPQAGSLFEYGHDNQRLHRFPLE